MEYVSPTEYGRRIRTRLQHAFTEDQPPYQIAMSLALGLFLAALPNFGASVVLLGWIGYRYEWANRLALLTAVLIMNPLAKGTVYASSLLLGVALIGPIGISPGELSLSAGPDVLIRLLVGNLLLAALFAAVGYAVGLYCAHAARRYYA